MNQPIQSRKNGEVAALRWKLNLQMFAGEEGQTEPGEPVHNEPQDPDDIVWEQFDSDKPQAEPETKAATPEVATPEPEKPKQDHETNKAFQEMRKAREDAERKSRQADEWAKSQFGHLGIETFEQYQQYQRDEAQRKDFEERGLDFDEYKRDMDQRLAQHPDVIRAKQDAARMEVNAEIRELKAAFPDVEVDEISDMSELRDSLAKLPNWEEIEKRVNRGYSLKDAYELSNRESIEQKRIEAAKQAERNKINGKGHLQPSGSVETGDVVMVPPDVLAQYRQIFKKQLQKGQMTEADFVAHYKKSLRGG